ncbi:uncharacterized protein SAPINGB_P000827 [Magnusiomyces paraingens]|uniref:Prefoldin subunit 6 n=1 Tax=Magnusiomyces paraingens TaxID=2606893 RepID=A0A5E8B2G3_9ASCO|nr:uncharacterized protein SAPINGB_P000827 [Saprochaete ingens]VVT45655.1 unnamed protein product [Saprochaete ingens]
MSAAPNTATPEVNELIDLLSTLQAELGDLIRSRETLEVQLKENTIVKDEFDTLSEDAKVYKLTGPVLLPQSKAEAETNVNTRLDFIKKEIERVEKNIAAKQENIMENRNKLAAMSAPPQQAA